MKTATSIRLETSYDFDVPFQRNLLAAAWNDRDFLAKAEECLRPDYFTDEVLAGVARALLHLWSAHRTLPDLPAVLERVREEVAPGRKYGEYEKEVKRVWSQRGTNTEYYRERAVEFARRQAVADAVLAADGLMADGKLDSIEPLLRRALATGGGLAGQSYNHLEEADARLALYVQRDGARSRDERRVPCGIGPIDAATQGGLGKGELGCVVGLAGKGKTTCLINHGANVLMGGRNVLHVTLENSLEVTAARYDARLFGRSMARIKKFPAKFQKHMAKLREDLTSRLLIRYYPTGMLTASTLEVEIERASPRPDVVFVDYAALMRTAGAAGGRDGLRFELADTFRDLRRVSGITSAPIWTAHQANRPGVGAEKLGMVHLSECFEIAGIVDVGLSINWDDDKPAEVSMYVWKNRLGKGDFEVPCSVNWETSIISSYSDEV